MLQAELFGLLEERDITGIRARKAALDIVDTELIELFGNEEFVGYREAYAFTLRPISQGGVVDLDGFVHESAKARYRQGDEARGLFRRISLRCMEGPDCIDDVIDLGHRMMGTDRQAEKFTGVALRDGEVTPFPSQILIGVR